MRLHNRWCACVGQLLCANYNLDLWHTLFIIWYILNGISYKLSLDIWRIGKLEVYGHWNRHEIGMWKCYLFCSGAIRCLFLILFRKNRVLTIKKEKSLAVSRILLTFAVRVGADGKERLRWRLKWMSVLNVSLEIEMWKFQNSTMTNCNTAHAMGLLYPFLYKRKVSIYLLAWAIVCC